MRVIVESPFAGAGGGFGNTKYGRKCLRDCIDRGESPFASHLLYTQKGVLDDAVPSERDLGIAAAIGWLEVADYVAVYMDFGITPGMVKGIMAAARANKKIVLRWIEGMKKEQVIE